MKTYIAYFSLTEELNKIQLIKLVRYLTLLGLRDAKILVEEQIMPVVMTGFSLHLTELQLGRYYIAEKLTAVEGYSFSKGYALQRIEPVPKITAVDLTQCKEAHN